MLGFTELIVSHPMFCSETSRGTLPCSQKQMFVKSIKNVPSFD